jgi:crossover junction endodeoxyribonuclease RuvC
MSAPVLALDLASISGWACGEPGGKPAHGSHRFARAGASHEAIFAGAVRWINGLLNEYEPRVVVWEAPLAGFKGGKTTNDVTTVLFGLPAVIGAVVYLRGIYDIRKADTRDVRLHFIGSNPKRAEAKPKVIRQCRVMGWDVEDDNEADALATWSYMCSLIDSRLAIAPTPLFQGIGQ